MKSSQLFPIGIIVVIGLLFGWYYYRSQYRVDREGSSNEVVCTQEAKMCPDGSYVGRTGPMCEFAACPTATPSDVPTGWVLQTQVRPALTFKYPAKIGGDFISATDWPPLIRILDEKYSCSPAGVETQRAGLTEEIVIEGKPYCVTRVSEGAAGSTYTQYAYATARDTKTLVATFTIRKVNCGNYDEDKRPACQSEQGAFDPNTIIDSVIQTVSY